MHPLSTSNSTSVPYTTYKGDSSLTPFRLRSGFDRVSSESVSLPR